MKSLFNQLICELVYFLASADRYTDSDIYANYFIGQWTVRGAVFTYQWVNHKPTILESWLITFNGRTVFVKTLETSQ